MTIFDEPRAKALFEALSKQSGWQARALLASPDELIPEPVSLLQFIA